LKFRIKSTLKSVTGHTEYTMTSISGRGFLNPSPNEESLILKKETKKSQITRLKQVREQERSHSRKAVQKFNESVEEKRKREFETQKKAEFMAKKKEMEELLRQRQKMEEDMGKAQKEAEREAARREEEARKYQEFLKQAEQNAVVRGNQAWERHQTFKTEQKQKDEEVHCLERKKLVLEREKTLAHQTAQEYREKSQAESLLKQQQEENDRIANEYNMNLVGSSFYTKSTHIDFTATRFHNPVIVRHEIQEESRMNPSAMENAEIECSKTLDAREQATILSGMEDQKAAGRGKDALKKEQTKLQMNGFVAEMEQLRLANEKVKVEEGKTDKYYFCGKSAKHSQDQDRKQKKLESLFETEFNLAVQDQNHDPNIPTWTEKKPRVETTTSTTITPQKHPHPLSERGLSGSSTSKTPSLLVSHKSRPNTKTPKIPSHSYENDEKERFEHIRIPQVGGDVMVRGVDRSDEERGVDGDLFSPDKSLLDEGVDGKYSPHKPHHFVTNNASAEAAVGRGKVVYSNRVEQRRAQELAGDVDGEVEGDDYLRRELSAQQDGEGDVSADYGTNGGVEDNRITVGIERPGAKSPIRIEEFGIMDATTGQGVSQYQYQEREAGHSKKMSNELKKEFDSKRNRLEKEYQMRMQQNERVLSAKLGGQTLPKGKDQKASVLRQDPVLAHNGVNGTQMVMMSGQQKHQLYPAQGYPGGYAGAGIADPSQMQYVNPTNMMQVSTPGFRSPQNMNVSHNVHFDNVNINYVQGQPISSVVSDTRKSGLDFQTQEMRDPHRGKEIEPKDHSIKNFLQQQEEYLRNLNLDRFDANKSQVKREESQEESSLSRKYYFEDDKLNEEISQKATIGKSYEKPERRFAEKRESGLVDEFFNVGQSTTSQYSSLSHKASTDREVDQKMATRGRDMEMMDRYRNAANQRREELLEFSPPKRNIRDRSEKGTRSHVEEVLRKSRERSMSPDDGHVDDMSAFNTPSPNFKQWGGDPEERHSQELKSSWQDPEDSLDQEYESELDYSRSEHGSPLRESQYYKSRGSDLRKSQEGRYDGQTETTLGQDPQSSERMDSSLRNKSFTFTVSAGNSTNSRSKLNQITKQFNNDVQGETQDSLMYSNRSEQDNARTQKKSAMAFEVSLEGDEENKNGKSLSTIFAERRGNIRSRREVATSSASSTSRSERGSSAPGKSKEELLAIRKQMLKGPSSLRNKTAQERGRPTETLSSQESATGVRGSSARGPSEELLSRLATGEKAKVNRKDMHKLTSKNYEMLPEIKKRKEQEQKKADLKSRQEKVKEMEKKRRAMLQANRSKK